MIKKYWFLVQIPTLLVIPPILLSSCSSVESEISNFEKEVKKFNTSKKTIDPQKNSSEAVKSINSAPTNDDKISVLKSLSDFPLLSEGFKLEIQLAEIGSIRSQVNTNIILQEINTLENVASLTYTITGLTESAKTPIEIAAEVFKVPMETKSKNTLAYTAQTAINNEEADEDKINQLKNLIDLPNIDENTWQIRIKSAKVDEINKNKTELNVIINIFEKLNTENNLDVVLKITNFKISPTIEEEAQKFQNEVITSQARRTSYYAAKLINEASTQNDKINQLRAQSNDIPLLADGYFLNIDERATFLDTKIMVPIKIVDATNPVISKKAIITIFGLVQPLPIQVEVAKLEVPTPNILSTNISAIEAKNMIDAAQNIEAKLVVLNQIANVPILSTGTYISKIESVNVSGTTLLLSLTVSTSELSITNVVFQVTNFLPN